MTTSDVTLVFNNTPFLIVGGIVAAFLLLTVAARVLEWRRERKERVTQGEESANEELAPAPRREAMELIAKLGAVRVKMLELDRALTQRREGIRWHFGIGQDGDKVLRDADADSDVDRFLSDATERDLNAAQGEMISLFRDAANWLKKYAPEEAPPPPLHHRIAAALLTFAGRFFPALNRNADAKMIPVVIKAKETHLSDNSELPEKVASDETPTEAAAGFLKSREKLQIPIDLLKPGKSESLPDGASLLETSRSLANTLRTYKIDAVPFGTPIQGPSVTRYEFSLQQGTKLSKVVNLSNDIALSMGVNSVNITPTPGKNSVVGIEVKNQRTSLAPLRSALESRDFIYGALTMFPLGQGIDGKTIMGDIAELPHVLIAGTTGSGKSVFLNTLIVSLLYKATPEESRLLLIDPKQVELTPYDGIPHLTRPVVTNAKEAVAALNDAAAEMDRRYDAFKEKSVRTLDKYNAKVPAPFPRLVIIIDELADLMMTSNKAVENSIMRIAQMGRAAGIHLVIATQRPSATVITGLMKANIPSRIAFSVASVLESRIILDESGAEKLIGKGDMLFKLTGNEKKRIQGCYVSPEEIEKVVSFLKKSK